MGDAQYSCRLAEWCPVHMGVGRGAAGGGDQGVHGNYDGAVEETFRSVWACCCSGLVVSTAWLPAYLALPLQSSSYQLEVTLLCAGVLYRPAETLRGGN